MPRRADRLALKFSLPTLIRLTQGVQIEKSSTQACALCSDFYQLGISPYILAPMLLSVLLNLTLLHPEMQFQLPRKAVHVLFLEDGSFSESLQTNHAG